ncbi:MAG: hydroxyacylglutathione hydrolase [Deltaproteobacteria bacterium]|nr:hydroxyacylglutathione hydrolase [Deltaproteobacteria bacterium]
MRIVVVPCLEDNYAYLVIEGDRAAVVDPGEAAPILAAVAREGVTLTSVWATHHHPDHVGGVPELLRALPDLEIVAHERDRARVPGANKLVGDGDAIALGDVRATAIHNPGHTMGAVSYWIGAADAHPGAVFTGDTLFAAGCGRLFEGTAADMQASLARLTSLPETTEVYFGHEYTEANLKFAAAVEPDSAAVAARIAAARALRAAGRTTTPSTVAAERATNPFVRTADEAVRAAAVARDAGIDRADPSAVLGVIRTWKNSFR